MIESFIFLGLIVVVFTITAITIFVTISVVRESSDFVRNMETAMEMGDNIVCHSCNTDNDTSYSYCKNCTAELGQQDPLKGISSDMLEENNLFKYCEYEIVEEKKKDDSKIFLLELEGHPNHSEAKIIITNSDAKSDADKFVILKFNESKTFPVHLSQLPEKIQEKV